LLRTVTVKDLAEIFPDRFSNRTNGVTPRRWLLLANSPLRAHDHRRDWRWLDHQPWRIAQTQTMAGDSSFQEKFLKSKRAAKAEFANWLKATMGAGCRSRYYFRLPDSSASTSTRGNCSTLCAWLCSTIVFAKTRTSNIRRELSCSPERRTRIPPGETHNQVHQ